MIEVALPVDIASLTLKEDMLWSIIPNVGTVRAFQSRLYPHAVQVLVKTAMANQHLCEV